MSTTRAIIRPATANDIDAVLALQREIHAEHVAWDAARWTLAAPIAPAYRAWVAGLIASGSDGIVLVASDADGVVGYLVAEIEPESTKHWSPRAMYLHDVYVAPSSRRSGVARKLVEALIAWSASRHPGVQLRLITAHQNAAARAFFERLGFRSCVVEMIREAQPASFQQ